jgi:arylsulfatase A-like enzyme
MMKHTLILLGLITLSLHLAASGKPNVLLILVDGLRPELGSHGAPHMVTPNLDHLASGSILFENAYNHQAIGPSSRISLFSGKSQQASTSATQRDTSLNLPETPITLTRHLGENGYWAIGMGRVYHDEQWQEWDDWTEMNNRRNGMYRNGYASPESIEQLKLLSDEAKEKGLEEEAFRQYARLGPTEQSFGPDSNYHDYELTDLAIERLKQRRDKDQPFFMVVGYEKPQLPFVAPERFWDLYDQKSLKQFDNPSLPEGAPQGYSLEWSDARAYKGVPAEGPFSPYLERELVHGYYACVSFVDEQIGRLVQALKEQNLADGTLIVFVGDREWKLKEPASWDKNSPYQPDTVPPLMIRLPDGSLAGSVSREPTEFIDLYPTLCEFLGVPLPGHLEGNSFAHLLKDPPVKIQKAAELP